MAPLIIPLLQVAAQYLPQIAGLFGSGSEVANRNLAAGKVLADAITSATNSPNLQAAVEKMAGGDGEAVKSAKAAVAQVWPELIEVGGGIKAARDANNAASQMPILQDRAFLVSLLLFSVPAMLLVDVFYVHPDAYDGNLRTQIVTACLLVISILGGYWLGSSAGSARKTERMSP